jgi:hypothetical protein
MKKRLMTFAAGVGAMVILGGVAFAAANSVSTTPPPAFVPGAETISVHDSRTSTSTVTTSPEPSSTTILITTTSEVSPPITPDPVAPIPSVSGSSTPTSNTVDNHGDDVGRHGADDATPTSTPSAGTAPSISAPDADGSTTSQPDDHGGDVGGHGSDDTQPDDHGGSGKGSDD